MLLAIDVGNTQTHVGMFRDDELVEHWRFATARFATADELAVVLSNLLGLRELRLADVDAAIVSSVVPTLAHEFEQVIERYLRGRGALVGHVGPLAPREENRVTSAGEYLGGVISPGFEISLEALAARAARLPRVEITRPEHAIGKGTQEAIQAGVVYGYAGQVDGILVRLREELGEEATAIATGGYAEAITPFCEQVDEVDDLLTLRGLKLIWERNEA